MKTIATFEGIPVVLSPTVTKVHKVVDYSNNFCLVRLPHDSETVGDRAGQQLECEKDILPAVTLAF